MIPSGKVQRDERKQTAGELPKCVQTMSKPGMVVAPGQARAES